MLGQASVRDDTTKQVISTCSNDELWKWLGAAPTTIELRVRRLGMWQTIALNPEYFTQVIGALVATLEVDGIKQVSDNGKITPGANPWLQQLYKGINSLRDFEGFAFLPETLFAGDSLL